MAGVINNPPLPYCGPISGGFTPGRLIRVKGDVQPNARCFAINLQCGPNTNPRDDVALHLSPVFSSPPRLVRNSIQGQRWGPEESHGPYFPLVAGQQFEIMILCEHNCYKIAINGQHFAEFTHRLPWQSVQFVAIDGEVRIFMLQFEGNAHAGSGPPPPGAPIGFVTPGQAPVPQPYSSGSRPYASGGAPMPYPVSGGGAPMPYPVSGGAAGPYPRPALQGYPVGGQTYTVTSGQPYPGGPSVYSHHAGSYPHHSKAGKAMPIVAGIGAGALTGYALSSALGHHRGFKHKHFKHKKFFKPKKFKFKHKFKHKHHGFGMFHHSSSSSSSEEE